jgi:hypothetical protein
MRVRLAGWSDTGHFGSEKVVHFPVKQLQGFASMNIRIRPATPTDIPTLRALIDASVRGLQSHDYTPAQIDGALASVYGVDTQLIADGTYFVAEDGGCTEEKAAPSLTGRIVG